MKEKEEVLDIIIIGAGPIGIACGIEAKKHNLSYLIFDKECLVNSIYHYPSNMTFFSTSEKLEIGDVPFISNLPKPTRPEALEYYRRVADKWRLDIHLYEEILHVVKQEEIFHVKTSKSNYSAKNIILATGFYDLPNLLNVPGENLPKVLHYYKEAHPFFRQNLIVIGAANSAIDAALECYRKGTHVTMVIRESEVSESVKYWARPDIINRIKEGSITAYFNSEIKEITQDEVIITQNNVEIRIKNDFVLAMTGYRPNFKFLASMGIEFNDDEFKTPMHNTENMETNVSGIYLAGVICGGLKTNKWFIENSRIHAQQIIEHVLSKIDK